MTPRGSLVTSTCVDCSASFTYELKSNYRTFCDACKKAKQRAAAAKAKRGSDHGSHRKRARKHGVPYEPINRKRLFERDGWRCYLCGVKVHLFKGDYADPKQATIDHILAMSNGGGHTWDNVRTCCFRCNSRKSAVEIDAQLHLV